MASTWANVDSNFPMFGMDDNVKEQMLALQNFMFALTEELKYKLDNLDMTNLNEHALDGYTGEITEQIFAVDKKNDTALEKITELTAALEKQRESGLKLYSIVGDLTESINGLTAAIRAGESRVDIGGEGIEINLSGTVKVNGRTI